MTASAASNGARSRARLLVLLAVGGGCGRSPLQLPGADAGVNARDGAPVMVVGQPPVNGQCQENLSPCGKGDGLRCYDLSQSASDCGACGHACAQGIACQAGTCQQRRCNGPLSFRAAAYTATGELLVRDGQPVLGDFDGDGVLDLVGVPETDGPVSLLYGAGNGTFPTHQAVESPPSRFWRAFAADVDRDGFLDLVSLGKVDNQPGAPPQNNFTFTVHLGSADRVAPFRDAMTYPTSGSPYDLLLADMDSDGRLDLLAAVPMGFDYWRGVDGGRFEQQAMLASRDSMGPFPSVPSPLATDWNADGIPDLVYPNLGNVHFRLGRGDGSLDAEVACPLAAGAIGDLDNDGRPDIVTHSSLLLGIESCHASKVVPLSNWPMQGGVALADFNGDGNLDVVADYNQNITVRVGNGQGGFGQSLSLPAPTTGQWPIGVFEIGDLNQDGKLDFVFARSDGWGVFLNTCQ